MFNVLLECFTVDELVSFAIECNPRLTGCAPRGLKAGAEYILSVFRHVRDPSNKIIIQRKLGEKYNCTEKTVRNSYRRILSSLGLDEDHSW